MNIDDYIDEAIAETNIELDEDAKYNGFEQAQEILDLYDWELAEYKAEIYDLVETQVGDDVDAETKEAIANVYAATTAQATEQLVDEEPTWRRRFLNWL